VYLIDELPMRYDLKLFQFIFESNGNYVLGTGMHEHAWLGG